VRERAQLGNDARREVGRGVEAGADRRPADGELGEMGTRMLDACDAVPNDAGIAAEFLAERDRHRVLQMRAAGFHHVGELPRFLLERVGEHPQRRNEMTFDAAQCGNVQRGGKDVVRALPHVHMIVRVHQRMIAALAAEQLDGAVGDHFVGVHVGRRAGSRLKHLDDELIVEASRGDFQRRLFDRLARLFGEQAQRHVRARGRRLDVSERGEKAPREAVAGDGKVGRRASRLSRVVRVGRHFHLAHTVPFDAERCAHHDLPRATA
jgi:hypothetical protein